MLEISDLLLSLFQQVQQVFILDPSHTATTLPFIALWSDFSDHCNKCGNAIKGTSFFSFSCKKYCDECRQYLSEEELAQEAASAQDFTNLLREVEQALGHDCDGLTDEEVRAQASDGFLDAVMKRKQEDILQTRRKRGG